MKNRFDKCGSDWAKWDLHVHTPCSIVQSYGGDTDAVWEKFITDLENLPPEFKVIGINDYLFIDGYKKILGYKEKGRLSNIACFLPLLEFRTKDRVGVKFDQPERINFHIIFSDKIIPEDIEAFIFSIQIKSSHYNFSKNLTRKNLEEFGEKIETKNRKESNLKCGANNFSVDRDKIITALEEKFKGQYLSAVGLAEWRKISFTDSNIEWKQGILSNENFIFSGSHSVEDFEANQAKLTSQKVNDLLLHSSDAHCFSDANSTKEEYRLIGRCYTWIKAEPTFEGLKMVLHERSRLQISETKPQPPLRTINKIEINLPETVLAVSKDEKNNIQQSSLFCFRGNHEIVFSPYFNCIIGGRGSGKSSLLNLLNMINRGQSTLFSLKNEGKEIIIDNHVKIDGIRDIDFITQGNIESIATDSKKLTPFIYDRLLQLDNQIADKIRSYTNQLNSHKTDINTCIDLMRKYQLKEKEREEKLNKKKDAETIIKAFDDEKFKTVSEEVKRQTKQLEKLLAAKENLRAFKIEISQIVDKYAIINEGNLYETDLNNIIGQIRPILNQTNEQEADKEIYELQNKIKKGENEIANYLSKAGLSPENSNEYQNALSQVPRLEDDITKIDMEMNNMSEQIIQIEQKKEVFRQTRIEIENLIKKAFIPLNQQLDIQDKNKNVQKIRFEYQFDIDSAKNAIYAKFKTSFSAELSGQREESIKQSLCFDTVLEVVDVSWEVFRKNIEQTPYSTAKAIVQKIFKQEYNFKQYQLFVLEHLIDVDKYKKIIGFYNERPLHSGCSFGQRCTAVIVALLMFGNKPLVIDEPEAHLDSKLIAEYLVTLIKEGKHRRQLIIATHNANFVINGDAEIVHCLSIDETDKTTILQTTIEDVSNRDRLLALEGGKEAFRKRERKLLNKSHH